MSASGPIGNATKRDDPLDRTELPEQKKKKVTGTVSGPPVHIRKPPTGLEPVTSPLPRVCSTTELRWRLDSSSGHGAHPVNDSRRKTASGKEAEIRKCSAISEDRKRTIGMAPKGPRPIFRGRPPSAIQIRNSDPTAGRPPIGTPDQWPNRLIHPYGHPGVAGTIRPRHSDRPPEWRSAGRDPD